MLVTLVYSPRAREVHEISLQVPVGCTVEEAVQASGLLAGMPPEQVESTELGVWGRKVAVKQVLHDQDRVEIYRPLTVDPKMARRARFATQGAKTAGLFAKRRAGAKAGY